MQVFFPYEDFEKTASVIDNSRINSQINEALVLVRSLTGVYKRNPKTGVCGWENHTVAKLWKGHELQLAKYGLAFAKEYLVNRNVPSAESLEKRKTRYRMWQGLIEEMERLEFEDTLPSLIGDEEFHSAFRSLLMYKECQQLTFKKWKRGEYGDHASTRYLLPRKSSWKRAYYETIWEFFGKPEPVWYGQWGWTEEPDDMKVFYTEDRIPQMLKEIKGRKENPTFFGKPTK